MFSHTHFPSVCDIPNCRCEHARGYKCYHFEAYKQQMNLSRTLAVVPISTYKKSDFKEGGQRFFDILAIFHPTSKFFNAFLPINGIGIKGVILNQVNDIDLTRLFLESIQKFLMFRCRYIKEAEVTKPKALYLNFDYLLMKSTDDKYFWGILDELDSVEFLILDDFVPEKTDDKKVCMFMKLIVKKASSRNIVTIANMSKSKKRHTEEDMQIALGMLHKLCPQRAEVKFNG